MLERRIRKTKREVMGMQEAVDKCKDEPAKFEMQLELDRKSFLLQQQNKAYNEFVKRTTCVPSRNGYRLQDGTGRRPQMPGELRGDIPIL